MLIIEMHGSYDNASVPWTIMIHKKKRRKKENRRKQKQKKIEGAYISNCLTTAGGFAL
jgi:hypothetical protein